MSYSGLIVLEINICISTVVAMTKLIQLIWRHSVLLATQFRLAYRLQSFGLRVARSLELTVQNKGATRTEINYFSHWWPSHRMLKRTIS